MGPLVTSALLLLALLHHMGPTPGIPLTASRYRIWSPETGEPVSLVSYAVPINALVFLDDRGQPTARLALGWRERDAATGDWFDTTLVRDYHLPPAKQGGYLQAVIVSPRRHDASDWAFSVMEEAGRHATVTESTKPLGDGPLALSDVVIGDSTQHFAWIVPGDSIILAPLGAVRHDVILDLFVQLRATAARSDTRTTIAVYRIDGVTRADEPALQIAWSAATAAGVTGIHRGLDISRLDSGDYDLQIRAASGSDSAVQTRRLVIR